MSEIQHRHVTRGSECVCGSDWNWIADACSFVVPIPEAKPYEREPEDFGPDGYFECRKGHAFCERH